MSDLISRKEAIDKIVSLKRETVSPLETDEAMNYILEVAASCIYYLPSAKLEKTLLTVKCEYWDNESHYCALNRPSAQPNLQPTCNRLATDRISRQAAIEELERGVWGKEYDKALAKVMLESLPSAQPERKKGEWRLFDGPNWYRCSECGAVRRQISFMENFCPNCGADMRGEQDG